MNIEATSESSGIQVFDSNLQRKCMKRCCTCGTLVNIRKKLCTGCGSDTTTAKKAQYDSDVVANISKGKKHQKNKGVHHIWKKLEKNVMQLYGAGIACLVLYYPSSPGTKRRLHYGSRDILDCYKEMMNSDKGKQLLKIFRLMSEQYIGSSTSTVTDDNAAGEMSSPSSDVTTAQQTHNTDRCITPSPPALPVTSMEPTVFEHNPAIACTATLVPSVALPLTTTASGPCYPPTVVSTASAAPLNRPTVTISRPHIVISTTTASPGKRPHVPLSFNPSSQKPCNLPADTVISRHSQNAIQCPFLPVSVHRPHFVTLTNTSLPPPALIPQARQTITTQGSLPLTPVRLVQVTSIGRPSLAATHARPVVTITPIRLLNYPKRLPNPK